MTAQDPAARERAIRALLDSGKITAEPVVAERDANHADYVHDLLADGHPEIVAAMDSGDVLFAWPKVTCRGQVYEGGVCLISKDPANPHGVLTLAAAIDDSMFGGQLDDLYDALTEDGLL